ncbi:tRNA N6-adenosine(37)-N6-threonylcarbamoyltransferase complex dimerization subunit TsaB [Williamsoniiplasma somnilux]|uniref:tRNA N6-adenosine(37)-N6-threonylcarbamoyltransferase complex dimerization subunit TsaB n=1 Tax=Williamsoniiplasma somnilux TaxID=215578 RepID=A0A2K8P1R2_9MOLU|nr:tRNA (adenosine(37)-N6)-threonylcarbamoyltransferase complex dimerization subunit type 1 TsaB [Williamsoniiplasma somnilux]ATZ18951.1 tRNA N6-adenosine(37)-N6-threonylcarbamoyltransferase complex dimerization subunit TsaB [Williamsoniiplasma somnilux]
MNLFIDTSNWQLIYILEKDNKIIDSLNIQNLTKISDLAMSELKKFLKKNSLKIQEIENFYVTTGPGSYTGVRVGLTMVKTFLTLNYNYNVFTINSLKFQTEGAKSAISILDARGNKSYFAIYNETKTIISETVLSNLEIENLLKEHSDLPFFKDYKNLNYCNAFLNLKPFFIKAKKLKDLVPLYIKSFI